VVHWNHQVLSYFHIFGWLKDEDETWASVNVAEAKVLVHMLNEPRQDVQDIRCVSSSVSEDASVGISGTSNTCSGRFGAGSYVRTGYYAKSVKQTLSIIFCIRRDWCNNVATFLCLSGCRPRSIVRI
jgi:hypothetical protein